MKDALKGRASLEFVWHPYATHPSFGMGVDGTREQAPEGAEQLLGWSYSNASIYTHVLHTHYSAPRGFDFENPEGQTISEWNLASRAQAFASDMRNRAKAYRTPNLLIPFGDDFKFQDANRQFSNMDQIIKYINEHNGVDEETGKVAGNGEAQYDGMVLRYSTLGEYFDSVAAHLRGDNRGKGGSAALAGDLAPVPIPVYGPSGFNDGGQDFFPYADNPSSFWTGYYVSRPQLKLAIRRTAALLRGGEALVSMVRPWADAWQGATSGIVEAFTDATLNNGKGKMSTASAETLKAAVVEATPYASFSWLRAAQRLEQVRLDAALSLHHDAITGTSRDSVVADYTQRMNAGYDDVLGVTTDVASLLLGGLHRSQLESAHVIEEINSSPVDVLLAASSSIGAMTQGDTEALEGLESTGKLPELASLAPAPLTHIPHVLPVLEALRVQVRSFTDGDTTVRVIGPHTPAHPVVLYNPSGWKRRIVATVVVNAAADSNGAPACRKRQWPVGLVTEEGGLAVPSQWIGIVEDAGVARSSGSFAAHMAEGVPQWQRTGIRYELSFSAELPPMSLRTYFVTAAWRVRATQEDITGADSHPDDTDTSGPACGTADEIVQAAAAKVSTAMIQLKGSKGGDNAQADDTPTSKPRIDTQGTDPAAVVTIENACVALEVSRHTGLLLSITRKHADTSKIQSGASSRASAAAAKGVRMTIVQRFGMYETRQSGAYLFRPLDDPSMGSMDQSAASNDVTVSVSTIPADATGSGHGLLQVVRVAGPKFSQTIRLTDTLGWDAIVAGGSALDPSAYAAVCNDPLHPDSAFEVLPSVHADGNQELVMVLETDVNVLAHRTGESARSTNTRDQMKQQGYHPELDNGSAGVHGCPVDGLPVPYGWWTGDGLGLLRRSPPPQGLSKDQLSRFFYPLNTLTRISGPVTSKDAVEGGDSWVPSAWLTIYTQSPFGVMTRMTERSVRIGGAERSVAGARMELMLHRHLSQDDGRGLATGVYDSTTITPRLLFTVGAALHSVKGATQGGECGSESQDGNIHDAAAAKHEDWTWKWASRSAQHSVPVMQFHSDLARLRQRLGSAAVQVATVSADRPPADSSMDVGGVIPQFALAEAPVPRSEWTKRYSTSWAGLPPVSYDNAHKVTLEGLTDTGALPPWVHLLTLQPRDAITDDVAVRLQNVGGPAVTIDMTRLLAGAGVATAGVTQDGASSGGLFIATSVRSRSLTMNGPDTCTLVTSAKGPACGATCAALSSSVTTSTTQRKRGAANPWAFSSLLTMLRTSSDGVRRATAIALSDAGSLHAQSLASDVEISQGLSSLGDGAQGAAGGQEAGDYVERQNTNEEGVFISDAALEKARKAAGQRRLLQAPQGRRLQEDEEDEGRPKRAKAKRAAKKKGVPQLTWTAIEAATAVVTAREPSSMTLAPASIRSFFLTLRPTTAGSKGNAGTGDSDGDETSPVAFVEGGSLAVLLQGRPDVKYESPLGDSSSSSSKDGKKKKGSSAWGWLSFVSGDAGDKPKPVAKPVQRPAKPVQAVAEPSKEPVASGVQDGGADASEPSKAPVPVAPPSRPGAGSKKAKTSKAPLSADQLPADAWASMQQAGKGKKGKGKGRAGDKGSQRLASSLDKDAGDVPVPFARGSEDGEDISVGSLALSLTVWLLAASGLLAGLRCMCGCGGTRKRKSGGILPTTIGDVQGGEDALPAGLESLSSNATGWFDAMWSSTFKRVANPGKTQ